MELHFMDALHYAEQNGISKPKILIRNKYWAKAKPRVQWQNLKSFLTGKTKANTEQLQVFCDVCNGRFIITKNNITWEGL